MGDVGDPKHTQDEPLPGLQILFIGLGAVVASALPWLLTNVFHVGSGDGGHIPLTVRLSFYMGAAAFFGAVMSQPKPYLVRYWPEELSFRRSPRLSIAFTTP